MLLISSFFYQNMQKINMDKLDTIFTAAGCACRPNVLDWCYNTNFICFAISLDVGLVGKDEATGRYKLLETAATHSAEITSLKFVTQSRGQHNSNATGLLVTGSCNGELCLWKLDQNSSPRISIITKYEKLVDSLPVTLARGYFWDVKTHTEGILLSAHCDSIHFHLPIVKQGQIALETIRFGQSLVLNYDLLCVGDILMMAVGLSNGCVEIYCTDKCCSRDFTKRVCLKQAHSGWIRDVAFKSCADASRNFYLATSSDTLIRIWSLQDVTSPLHTVANKEVDSQELKLKPLLLHVNFNTDITTFEVKLDSVLVGHDANVHSIRWHPQALQLVSSSMDKNVLVWEPSSQHQENIWVPTKRFGEMGGEAVGFYDAIFSPDGSKMLYHSFFGALLMWKVGEEACQVEFTVGGHFGSVTDLDWEKNGSYLITCSLDKTTRIFSQLKESKEFVEVARPQLHGHSLNCLASVSSNYFVSGGEEKIFRTFQTTFSFVKTMKNLCGVSVERWKDCNSVYAASQPELGLSNKAIIPSDDQENGSESLEARCIFKVAPSDEQLSTCTLFPEVYKLYGHGFEVFCVCVNHKSTLLATGCKASHAEHATIMIWSTIDWQRKSIIAAHQLTITQMCFSPNDKYLLSVSRDRTWNLFSQTSDSENDFVVVSTGDKRTSGHSRIIWAAAWTHDSKFFATASRDRTVNVWMVVDNGTTVKSDVYTSSDSVTAVDYAPNFLDRNFYLLAAGLDNGQIILLKWSFNGCSSTSGFEVIGQMNHSQAFCGSVRRIRFRPIPARSNEAEKNINDKAFEFASCSLTHIIKVYRFNYYK